MPVEYELNEQITLMQAVDRYIGRYPELTLLHASANGMKRSKAAAGKLKASGVKAGVPDLFLPVARGSYHGLFIELKVVYPSGKKNTTSAEQRGWLDALNNRGYKAVVCYGWENALDTLLDYMES